MFRVNNVNWAPLRVSKLTSVSSVRHNWERAPQPFMVNEFP